MPNIICIAGPTASGKTALAVELAKELDGEVVSCDSMQIYRRMDIGTAIRASTLPCEWSSPYMWVKTDEALDTINAMLNPYTTDLTEEMVEFYSK